MRGMSDSEDAQGTSLTSLELAPCFACPAANTNLAESYLQCSNLNCAGLRRRTPMCQKCLNQKMCPRCSSEIVPQDVSSVSNRLCSSAPTSSSWDQCYTEHRMPEASLEPPRGISMLAVSQSEHIRKTIIVPGYAVGRVIG